MTYVLLIALFLLLTIPVRGKFKGIPMQILPGQTTTATIKAFNALSAEVPHGPVTFNDPGNGVTFSSDDTTATYTVPATASPGSIAVTASFTNSVGATVIVSDYLDVQAAPEVATSGAFVFTPAA